MVLPVIPISARSAFSGFKRAGMLNIEQRIDPSKENPGPAIVDVTSAVL
jgi:hypothetical protein